MIDDRRWHNANTRHVRNICVSIFLKHKSSTRRVKSLAEVHVYSSYFVAGRVPKASYVASCPFTPVLTTVRPPCSRSYRAQWLCMYFIPSPCLCGLSALARMRMLFRLRTRNSCVPNLYQIRTFFYTNSPILDSSLPGTIHIFPANVHILRWLRLAKSDDNSVP